MAPITIGKIDKDGTWIFPIHLCELERDNKFDFLFAKFVSGIRTYSGSALPTTGGARRVEGGIVAPLNNIRGHEMKRNRMKKCRAIL